MGGDFYEIERLWIFDSNIDTFFAGLEKSRQLLLENLARPGKSRVLDAPNVFHLPSNICPQTRQTPLPPVCPRKPSHKVRK